MSLLLGGGGGKAKKKNKKKEKRHCAKSTDIEDQNRGAYWQKTTMGR